jgi:hypothetical protein
LRNIPSIAKESTIRDITDQLPKNPRVEKDPNYTWAGLLGKRSIESLTSIVVHHTAMKKEMGLSAVNHARNHIRKKWKSTPYGEPGIAYHLYIKEGQIYQVNDILDYTYGVANNNGYTVHICVEGDYRYDALSEMDRKALYIAILSVKSVLPNFQSIKGHGELSPSACPALDMDRIRQEVESLEEQLIYYQSDNHQRATAYAIAERILDLYKKAQNDPSYGEEAIRKLMLLEKPMKEIGLI